jgi:predicted GIY-YIG superfamily endonuclease
VRRDDDDDALKRTASQGNITIKGHTAHCAGMACYRCGRRGHFSEDCYASTSVKPSEITCFRCGRDGHLSTDCYASTSVKTGGKITCFRCGRVGHYSNECYASSSVTSSSSSSSLKVPPQKRPRLATITTTAAATPARSGVYVLRYPGGHVYVGKSHDIDARILQHKGGEVGCTSMRRGTPEEVSPLTSRMGEDHEAWERNETLEQMRTNGIERVRGWMYTTRAFTAEMIESIEAQLCEKYDLCRRCGNTGHFAAQCDESDY